MEFNELDDYLYLNACTGILVSNKVVTSINNTNYKRDNHSTDTILVCVVFVVAFLEASPKLVLQASSRNSECLI